MKYLFVVKINIGHKMDTITIKSKMGNEVQMSKSDVEKSNRWANVLTHGIEAQTHVIQTDLSDDDLVYLKYLLELPPYDFEIIVKELRTLSLAELTALRALAIEYKLL